MSGKNFFELINVQNKSNKNQQIKQKKPLNLPVNCAKSVPYSDVVLHCINVSLQEQQKKLAMYQKKVDKKVGLKAKVESSGCCSPDFQYMNIYKNQKQRLSCFKNIQLEQTSELDEEKVFDASAYETQLELLCKKLNTQSPQKVEQ